MVTLISHSPEETARLGQSWGRDARPGWVFGLIGDMGAGKTQLVKGIAAGLGVTGRVHSPTFSLLNEYGGGRLRMVHLDLFRLSSPQEIIRAGLEDYLHPGPGITVVEWFDRWLPEVPEAAGPVLRPARLRRVLLEWLGESERRIEHEDFGA